MTAPKHNARFDDLKVFLRKLSKLPTPIEVTEKLVVLEGHYRFLAWKDLNKKMIEVKIV